MNHSFFDSSMVSGLSVPMMAVSADSPADSPLPLASLSPDHWTGAGLWVWIDIRYLNVPKGSVGTKPEDYGCVQIIDTGVESNLRRLCAEFALVRHRRGGGSSSVGLTGCRSGLGLGDGSQGRLEGGGAVELDPRKTPDEARGVVALDEDRVDGSGFCTETQTHTL
ncbi:hypothetical protein EYF80_055691 [Liparis tanakae]|uniref:Uncharacterized protein n=1 Tax=Liparis tanakae TaxID=230148 RepID=A0A4Z2EZ36_9TELE|nr:hypothetical protein EYF80_055691 [Liparis tanakae]